MMLVLRRLRIGIHAIVSSAVLVLCGCGHDRAVVSAGSSGTATPASSAPADDPAAQAVVGPVDEHGVRTRAVSEGEVRWARLASAVPRPHDHPGFDRAAYVSDPSAYLSRALGGRCYDVCAPASDVAALVPVGPTGFVLRTGEEATLIARTEPGMPVTFTSFGLGEFTASGLQTVTVAADGAGDARARFRMTRGTVGNCLITAGSPVRASTLQFLVSNPESH